jgi:hypothetical protein
VFIDETWVKTNMAPMHGRCRHGQRLYAKVPHAHWKMTTFVAALRHDGITAPFVPDQWRMFPRLSRNGARSDALAWRHRFDRQSRLAQELRAHSYPATLSQKHQERRMGQIEESVAGYLHHLDGADRQVPSLARTTKSARLKPTTHPAGNSLQDAANAAYLRTTCPRRCHETPCDLTAPVAPATNIFMSISRLLCFNASAAESRSTFATRVLRLRALCPPLFLENGLWRVSEADGHPIIGVHQADRDREIHEFAFLEHRPRGLVRFIRHTGLGNARHCFSPRKGGTLTFVKQISGFTRLTNGFSKKIENHAHQVALHFMYYNFVRIHSALRMTPAMAAGVSERLWEINDIVALVEANDPKPVRRGSYKKTEISKMDASINATILRG